MMTDIGREHKTSNRTADKLQGYNILVAEDEYVNRAYVNIILRKHNYNVIEAENGSIAFEIFTSGQNIDLVLMDLKMPVMDGWEATRLIRQHDPYARIIIISAWGLNREKQRALDAGADMVMSKPVKPDELLYAINRYL
ncbi:MAG: response regulator [Bacteroidales bacterium]|nr:response regulator [Bacteroidales bacterium]